MANTTRPLRVTKRLQALVDFARKEGWVVTKTPGGHLKFVKPGCTPVYSSSTTSDLRSHHNARAQLRRSGRCACTKVDGGSHG